MNVKDKLQKYHLQLIILTSLFLGLLGGLGFMKLWSTQGWETGFASKKVWDWLDLLIIPIVLALGAILFNWRENKVQRELAEAQREADREISERDNEIDREISRDKRHEDILQHYFDKMTDLMMDEHWLVDSATALAQKKSNDTNNFELMADAKKLFDIARVRTVSTLRALEGDTKRQTSVMHFLQEADLYNPENRPALLAGAIMTDINMSGLIWKGINLEGTNLMNSNLQDTGLWKANLKNAILQNADLTNAIMEDIDLQEAKISRSQFENKRV